MNLQRIKRFDQFSKGSNTGKGNRFKMGKSKGSGRKAMGAQACWKSWKDHLNQIRAMDKQEEGAIEQVE